MPFDGSTITNLRPGERLLHGAVYVFDHDLLNAHLADEAVALAPADLTALSDADVSALWLSWLNCDRRRRRDEAVRAFGQRICAERASRPLASAERAA